MQNAHGVPRAIRSVFALLLLLQGSVTAPLASAQSAAAYLPGDVMAPWEGGPAYYARWAHGPSTDPNVFPLAVWLQTPANATAYRALGINQFIGLWQGPTEAQLAALAARGMPAVCDQNAVGLNSANNGMINGWMHQDEPDNAQNGTQDPVPPASIVGGYATMVAADASRPVFLNLGQGVACDAWYGRGSRTNHPEDYAQYALGADILSFDTYPMNVYPRPSTDAPWFRAFNDAVAQHIWYVALGVDRLRQWTNYAKPVWAWIECTNISGDARYALTPVHIKAEVWMALIHGARGIGYFCHEFNPFIEAGPLHYPATGAALTAINAQITALAPVLNTQSVANGVTVTPADVAIPVATMLKRAGAFTYVFAVSMRPGATTASFALRDFSGEATVEVIGESRSLAVHNGVFADTFSTYAVHLYKVATPSPPAGFAGWAAANALSGDPLADPEGAGVTNLQRYAFGLAARGPVAPPTTLGSTTVDPGPQRCLTIIFDRRADGTDLRYFVEGSNDLANWSLVTPDFLSPGSPTHLEVPDSVPMDTAGMTRRFLRVRLQYVP